MGYERNPCPSQAQGARREKANAFSIPAAPHPTRRSSSLHSGGFFVPVDYDAILFAIATFFLLKNRLFKKDFMSAKMPKGRVIKNAYNNKPFLA